MIGDIPGCVPATPTSQVRYGHVHGRPVLGLLASATTSRLSGTLPASTEGMAGAAEQLGLDPLTPGASRTPPGKHRCSSPCPPGTRTWSCTGSDPSPSPDTEPRSSRCWPEETTPPARPRPGPAARPLVRRQASQGRGRPQPLRRRRPGRRPERRGPRRRARPVLRLRGDQQSDPPTHPSRDRPADRGDRRPERPHRAAQGHRRQLRDSARDIP